MGDTVDIGILASLADHGEILLGGTASQNKKHGPFFFWLLAYQKNLISRLFLYISLTACSTKNPIAQKWNFNFHI